MKKLFLVLVVAVAGFGLVKAQNSDSTEIYTFDEVNWQLDSLMPCYHFLPKNLDSTELASLNSFGYSPDSVPIASAAVLDQRLQEMGTVIPMEYNSYVHAYINLYAQKRREQVERMLGLSEIYFPIFEAELDRQGVPMELKHLPIVESALNPHARSRVGATGLWQFMLATGKMFGLEVTSYVDERKDPYKSTEAAVKYLKNMYRTYGDWLLVIAAYNCGPGNVNKAISRSGGKRTFWEIREHLPRETRGYVPAFIAATYVFNYPSEHNLYPRNVDFTFNVDTVMVEKKKFSLKRFSEVTSADFYFMKDLNPELQRDIVPYSSKPYTLRVPMAVGQLVAIDREAIFAQIVQGNPDTVKTVYASNKVSPLTNKPYKAVKKTGATTGSGNLVYHKVRSGETVSGIAAKYGVSYRKLSSWNGLRRYRIKPGQRLKVYVASNSRYAKASKAKTKPVTKVVNGAKYYTVRSGDTLWDIAQSQKTTVASIKTLNGMKTSRLKPGMQIRVN